MLPSDDLWTCRLKPRDVLFVHEPFPDPRRANRNHLAGWKSVGWLLTQEENKMIFQVLLKSFMEDFRSVLPHDDDSPGVFRGNRLVPPSLRNLVISWTAAVEIVDACLICSMLKLNQLKKNKLIIMKLSQHSWFHMSALWNVMFFSLVPVPLLSGPRILSAESGFSWRSSGKQKKWSIYKYIFKKKEACMFSTVCTWYFPVALAASVPMLWERFTFGHSCNYSVVLSENVSTWNKKNICYFFHTFY